MDVVLLIARLLLAGVFGLAGVAKITDPVGSRQALLDFGVPKKLAGALRLGLPVFEILVALALLPRASAWWGGTSALVLLIVFTAGITLNLVRGKAPDCRCFGQIHSAPVGRATLARNLVLMAIAGFIVIAGKDNAGMSAVGWLGELKTAEVINLVLGVAAIGLLSVAIVTLNRVFRQQADLLGGMQAINLALNGEAEPAPAPVKRAPLPAEGLPIGAKAPKFSLATVTGDQVSLNDLLGQGKSVLLLFVGANCWGCKILLPAARAWQREYGDRLTVAVLSSGALQEVMVKMYKYDLSHLLLDGDSKVADEYQAKWTPAAVLINPDGSIASQVVFGNNALREWVRNLIAGGTLQPGASSELGGHSANGANGHSANGHIPQVATVYSVLRLGDPAPRFTLKDLSGKVVNLEDLLGSPTLLLFWNVRCRIGKTMLADLKKWDEHPPHGAAKLVFIVTGEKEDVKEAHRRFKSLSLHDPAFDVAPLYGTKFTPSAILMDGQGRVASGLAIGHDNVRALIGLPKAELPAELRV